MKRILLVSLAAVSTAAFAADFDFGPGSIPDNLATGVTLTMALPAISSVQSVTFFGLTHTWCGDVTLRVITPDLVAHDIVARIGRTGGSGFGSSSDFAGDYVFLDGGADIWAAASSTPIPGGNYQLSTVNNGASTLASIGPQAAGNWSIFGVDEAGGDIGGWQNARVTATVVPEPVSILALGAGLAALARRRRK